MNNIDKIKELEAELVKLKADLQKKSNPYLEALDKWALENGFNLLKTDIDSVYNKQIPNGEIELTINNKYLVVNLIDEEGCDIEEDEYDLLKDSPDSLIKWLESRNTANQKLYKYKAYINTSHTFYSTDPDETDFYQDTRDLEWSVKRVDE